ncbi:hypothetical protein KL921_001715 [Ogataea angusta]|nr:hypothetical protein KL921_001715 [Ogataea angusta]
MGPEHPALSAQFGDKSHQTICSGLHDVASFGNVDTVQELSDILVSDPADLLNIGARLRHVLERISLDDQLVFLGGGDGGLAALPHLDFSESFFSQEVSDLDVVLAVLGHNVDVDREVRVHKSHLVSEADSDALDQVGNDRFHSSQRGDVFSVSVVNSDFNLCIGQLGEGDVDVAQVFLQLAARTPHEDVARLDDERHVLRNVEDFGGLDVLHGEIDEKIFTPIFVITLLWLPSSLKNSPFCFNTGMLQSFQQQARRFHASRVAAALSKQKRMEIASHKKKHNIVLQSSRLLNKEKVDPVLGRPNNPFIERLKMEIEEPTVLAKKFNLAEVDKLLYGAKESKVLKSVSTLGYDEATVKQIEREEAEKREILLRILSMRNADEQERNRRVLAMAVAEFGRFEGDTGSSEVQAAAMTVRLFNLMEHIKQNPQDKIHIRRARMLTQQRQKLLKYLKKDNPQRYYWAIEKLGLTDEVVHMEFNFDKRYMQDFEIWPGRQLIRPGKRETRESARMKRLLTKERLDELQIRTDESEQQQL